MRVGGVDVAERALQRVSCINRAAAGRLEQDVDRPCAQRRGIGAVAAIAGALLEARDAPSPTIRSASSQSLSMTACAESVIAAASARCTCKVTKSARLRPV